MGSERAEDQRVFFCWQILQSIANHVLFTKEEHMRPFNDFVKSNFDAARR